MHVAYIRQLHSQLIFAMTATQFYIDNKSYFKVSCTSIFIKNCKEKLLNCTFCPLFLKGVRRGNVVLFVRSYLIMLFYESPFKFIEPI